MMPRLSRTATLWILRSLPTEAIHCCRIPKWWDSPRGILRGLQLFIYVWVCDFACFAEDTTKISEFLSISVDGIIEFAYRSEFVLSHGLCDNYEYYKKWLWILTDIGWYDILILQITSYYVGHYNNTRISKFRVGLMLGLRYGKRRGWNAVIISSDEYVKGETAETQNIKWAAP